MKAGLLALPFAALAPVQLSAQSDLEPRVILRHGLFSSNPAIIRPAQPRDGLSDWLKASDFPAEFFDARQGWGTELNIVVNLDDTVAECTPRAWRPNTAAALERACELVREKGSFRHAIDTEGRPQRGSVRLDIGFYLVPPSRSLEPGPPPQPPGPQNTMPRILDESLLVLPADPARFLDPEAAVWLEIDRNGRVQSCLITNQTGTDAGDAFVCQRMKLARFEPSRTPNGDRVPRTVLVKLSVQP